MKIAFCLYGQPRCYKKGFNNINEFILMNKDFDFDFFFHTWTINKNQRYSVSPWRNINNEEIIYNDNCESELISLYNPCAYEFENQISKFDENIYINSMAYKNTPNYKKENIYNTLSQLYSKNKVRNILYDYIIRKNEKYDAVIACRFDYQNKIQIILNDVNFSFLNVSDMQQTLNILPTVFLISPVEVFLQWFTFFDNLNNIIDNNELCIKLCEYKTDYEMNAENLEVANFLYFYNNLDKVSFLKNILNFV